MNASIRLTALGDVALVGAFGARFVDRPICEVVDPALIELFSSSEICLANLECVLTTSEAYDLPGYGLRTPPAAARALKCMGISVASLANNHIRDVGDPGVRDTLRHLEDLGIATCGAGPTPAEAHQPLLMEKNGVRVGLLAVAERENNLADETRAGAAPFEPERLPEDIRRVKAEVDVVIVSIHAGHEFARVPSPRIREAYRNAVRAGAACVLGHHPHVIQGMEIFDSAPIFYSLGNFCFDSAYVASYPGWDTGLVAELHIDRTGVRSFQTHPIHITRGERITRLVGPEAQSAQEHFDHLSALIQNEENFRSEWMAHVNWRFERDYLPNLKRLDSDLRGTDGSRVARLLRNYFYCPTHQELIADYFGARMKAESAAKVSCP